jgi:hypothetical protein
MMIRHVHFLIAVTAVGLSGPAHADSGAALFDQCHAKTLAPDSSAECIALREETLARISDCIVEQRANAERSRSATATRTEHAYRARQMLCARMVREDYAAQSN